MQIDAVDMESAALMKACWIFDKKCLVVVGISNISGPNVTSPNLSWNKNNQALAEFNAAMTTVAIVNNSPK